MRGHGSDRTPTAATAAIQLRSDQVLCECCVPEVAQGDLGTARGVAGTSVEVPC